MKLSLKKRNTVISKNLIIAFIIAVAAAGVISCSGKERVDQDILTQKVTEKGRTPITILVKFAFSINNFEQVVEEKFPDIDIIQVGNYTRGMGIAEYESRLKNDDLPDIVMTWPLDVGKEYWEDRLLDLAGMEFTSRYNLSMLNDIVQNGKLHYLPGPSQVRGIIYNKTLFEENGWKVPENYEEFLELCKTIEDSGIRSIQLGFKNEEVLDTAFVGYNYADYFSKPQDMQWIADYNSGKGSFGHHFEPALDVFQDMIDAGIWKETDLDVTYTNRETMFFNRQCAMVEDSVLMARMGYGVTGTTDEAALMPFFNPGDDGDWARLYMVCYIGLNKHLEESANKEKYELVMKLMDYISTPEGQETLAADTGAMFSGLQNVPPPDIPEIQELIPALNQGRYAIFPTLKNAQPALREGLAGMVVGSLSKEEVIKMVDEQNLNPIESAAPDKLGTASEDFTIAETGSFVTDAMRESSGCEIALFLDNGKDGKYSGKGICARLYEGEITDLDIERIFPETMNEKKGILCKISMTGEDLIKTLEYSIPVKNNITGWFYYFSGIKVKFNPYAEMGSRVKEITMADGSEIDLEKIYTIAVMEGTYPEEFVKSFEETDLTIFSLISEKIADKGTISPSKDGRFIVMDK